jgi:hypothetical protein
MHDHGSVLVLISIRYYVVTRRPISSQRPQSTRDQQYRSSVYCDPRKDLCYATHAKHILEYVVISHNNKGAMFPPMVHADYL